MYMNPLVMLFLIYLVVLFVMYMFAALMALFVILYLMLCIYVCISAFRVHNNSKHPFTKISALVKEIKERNISFFLEHQSLLI